jgi:FAD/FMN-containing dehydrogenase
VGTAIPPREKDGCYHPATEAELASLIRAAAESGAQLRVMGSTHSVWRAIVTDAFDGPATPAAEFVVVLDRYTTVFAAQNDPADPAARLVEVQAGCHIGISPARPVQERVIERPERTHVRAPSPWHDGRWDRSLTSILHHRDGLALPDLGGISHQTIAGYLSTGSAGGTVKWSLHESIVKMRVIDASGRVVELTRDGGDAEWFRAAGIGLGLCGVISTVTLRCVPAYDISGRETISATRSAADMDFYGDRPGSGLPSLEQFLLDTDYTRLMWWPQRQFDRLVVWQAHRAPFDPRRPVRPYRQVTPLPVASQAAASIIYTVLGNLDAPDRAARAVRRMRAARPGADWGAAARWWRGLFTRPADPSHAAASRSERHSPIALGAAWVFAIQLLAAIGGSLVADLIKLRLLGTVVRWLRARVPEHIHLVLAPFVSTGKDGAPAIQEFYDRGFTGLPLDNQMDDVLMPTWFTEMWIPFTPGDGRVQEAITRLRRLFDADGTAEGCYTATGAFAFELYAARRDDVFFLSPAAGSHAFRVDVFWFANNSGNPLTDFFPQFWDALEPLGFRLHWGKFLPQPEAARRHHLTARYPEWDRWKAVRDRVDPNGVFLTRYWRDHLGLAVPATAAPVAAQPQPASTRTFAGTGA